MAVDMFLKLGAIKGESQDSKHKDSIDVLSFSWGVTQSGSFAHGGGGGSGKVSIQDATFVCRDNQAYPPLFLACATGEHLKEAKLTVRRAGKEQQEFHIWTFSEVLVSSVQIGSSHAEEVPTFTFSLNFTKVETEYKPQKIDGTLGAPAKAGWNQKLNVKV